jgi:hypothetical protein
MRAGDAAAAFCTQSESNLNLRHQAPVSELNLNSTLNQHERKVNSPRGASAAARAGGTRLAGATALRAIAASGRGEERVVL